MEFMIGALFTEAYSMRQLVGITPYTFWNTPGVSAPPANDRTIYVGFLNTGTAGYSVICKNQGVFLLDSQKNSLVFFDSPTQDGTSFIFIGFAISVSSVQFPAVDIGSLLTYQPGGNFSAAGNAGRSVLIINTLAIPFDIENAYAGFMWVELFGIGSVVFGSRSTAYGGNSSAGNGKVPSFTPGMTANDIATAIWVWWLTEIVATTGVFPSADAATVEASGDGYFSEVIGSQLRTTIGNNFTFGGLIVPSGNPPIMKVKFLGLNT